MESSINEALPPWDTLRNKITPEEGLWVGVIIQALQDALLNSCSHDSLVEKKRAIEWLTSNRQDFKMVCSMAGLSPTYVHMRAFMKLKEAGVV